MPHRKGRHTSDIRTVVVGAIARVSRRRPKELQDWTRLDSIGLVGVNKLHELFTALEEIGLCHLIQPEERAACTTVADVTAAVIRHGKAPPR